MAYDKKRYALLAYIAQKEGSSGRLGKKAMQKLVHLVENFSSFRSGYTFSFYTYGPFSKQLAGDIDFAEAIGLLNVKFNSIDNSYSIKAAEPQDDFAQKYLSGEEREAIDSVLRIFSGRTARDLELSSTIVFILSDPLYGDKSDEFIVERALELKPKYSKEEARNRLREVRQYAIG